VTFILCAPSGREDQMLRLQTACQGRRPFDFDVNLSQYLQCEARLLDIIRQARSKHDG